MEYLNEKNWIEKSKTLIYAEWSKFDIHELQIFETYLSRIDPRNPESSCVRFSKSEYAKMMGYAGTTSVKTKSIDRWVKNFLKKQITINYGDGDKRHVNLFSDATVHKDKNTGEIVIDLDCNMKLKPVFFNIAETGYISYRRRNTLEFKSQYTLKLYCMLKDHAWGNYEWVVDLKDLKNSLGAVETLYEKFPEFNRRILKKAQDEINGNTDIEFNYEKITKGRLTRAIKFKIRQIKDTEQLPGQMNIYDYPEAIPEDDPMQRKYDLWSDACNGEFSRAQIEELSMLANAHVEYTLGGPEQHELDVYHYLLIKYKALNAKNQNEVKSRYGYMKWLVENNK